MTNKFSFEQLLTQEIQLTSEKNIKINKISIPILQRDYAQGRKSYYEILDKDEVVLNLAGERFIKEIFSTLESSGELELDFIYGSIYEDKDNDGNLVNVLSPLDGQQRLTTLFLLYWFIGGKELDLTARKKLAEMLKNFTYMTRMSSTFFCADLAKELTKNDASSIFKDGNESIVSQIKNLPWYHGSYNLDPTIDAMLNMLARIQCIYNEKTGDCGKLYENLDKLKFYILPLQDFELSDELYVKMNARGKQLTEFENFKADLQNWLKKLKLGRKKYYNVEMPYDMYFISKMDNEWLQCFWNVGINTDGKNFDRLFLSFFYNFLLNDYVLKENVKNEELAKDPTYIALNKPQYSEFTIFENCLDETLLEKIETFLDNVCKNYKDIQEVCKPSWGDENFDIFKYIFKEEMELKDRTIFSALIFYLTQSAFDKDKLQDWMHFAWNITENANIDSVSVYAGVCILFKGLAKFAKEYAEETKTDKFDIYAVLTQKNIITSSTPAKIAVTEEILKAKLITRDTSWRDALLKAEGHQFFKGSMLTILTKTNFCTVIIWRIVSSTKMVLWQNIEKGVINF